VVKHSLEIKQSAQKELDSLDEAVFTRIDRKIQAAGGQSAARGLQKVARLQR